MLAFDKKARTADYNSRRESYQNDTMGHQMGQKYKNRLVETTRKLVDMCLTKLFG